ncbi:MAG: hypothetical protein Q8Q03_00210 [bacterium]|nr:hypothetical protein [bacterium]
MEHLKLNKPSEKRPGDLADNLALPQSKVERGKAVKEEIMIVEGELRAGIEALGANMSGADAILRKAEEAIREDPNNLEAKITLARVNDIYTKVESGINKVAAGLLFFSGGALFVHMDAGAIGKLYELMNELPGHDVISMSTAIAGGSLLAAKASAIAIPALLVIGHTLNRLYRYIQEKKFPPS